MDSSLILFLYLKKGLCKLEKQNKSLSNYFLFLRKWNSLPARLETLLYFCRELPKSENQKLVYLVLFFSYFLFVKRELFKHKHKTKLSLKMSLLKNQSFSNCNSFLQL